MPEYTIKELTGCGSLDGGLVKYGAGIDFLVYRDGFLIGPYDSRELAERAIERLRRADGT